MDEREREREERIFFKRWVRRYKRTERRGHAQFSMIIVTQSKPALVKPKMKHNSICAQSIFLRLDALYF